MRFKLKLICLISLLISKSLISQINSGEWYDLFDDKGIKVQLKLDITKDGCLDGGSPTTISHRYNGILIDSEEFINWSIKIIGCNGKASKYTHSVSIGGNEIIEKLGSELIEDIITEDFDHFITNKEIISTSIEDISISTNKIFKYLPIELNKTIYPTSILSDRNEIKYGEQINLSLTNGSLALGSKWVWYEKGSNGDENIVGNGKTITIRPQETSTYILRVEGPKEPVNNNFNIIKKIVVDITSDIPDNILGESEICKGDEIEVEIDGGKLGPGSKWVWYKNGCGTNLKIGNGKRILISPEESIEIYVRSEGPNRLYSECINKKIKVYKKTKIPSEISSNFEEICLGEKVVLKVVGNLEVGSKWEWVDGQSLKSLENKRELIAWPTLTRFYKVRATSDICENTDFIKKEIIVNKISNSPIKILKRYNEKNRLILYFDDGNLGTDAEWKWYKEIINKNRENTKLLLKEGNEYKPDFKNETYYLRAEGGKCENSNFIYTEVQELKKEKEKKENSEWLKNYSETRGNFHRNLNFGIDFIQLNDTISSINNSSINELHNLSTYGLNIGIILHPLIREFFTFGVYGSYSIGLNNFGWFDKEYSKDGLIFNESYKYNTFQFGSELLFGISNNGKVKLLIDWNRMIQENDFQLNKSQYYSSNIISEFSLNKSFIKEDLNLGFRFGTYSHFENEKKMGNQFDIFLLLTNYNNSNLISFDINNYNLDLLFTGLGINWWIHNRMRLNLNVSTNKNMKEIDFNNIAINDYFFQGKLNFTIDQFK